MIEVVIASGTGGLIGMSLGLVVAKNRLKDEGEKDEIPETVECPGCSRRIERGAFCRHCGEYLSWEDQADEPAGVDVDEKDDESLSILGRVAARIPVEIEVEDSEDETETTETETTETESIGEETPEDKDYVEIDVEEDLDDGRTVYRGEIS
jgi:hypothetical protein